MELWPFPEAKLLFPTMSDHDADSAAIDAENAAYAVADVANDADAFAEDDTYADVTTSILIKMLSLVMLNLMLLLILLLMLMLQLMMLMLILKLLMLILMLLII